MSQKILALCLVVCLCVLVPAAAHDAVRSADLSGFPFLTGNDKAVLVLDPSDDQILDPYISADLRLVDAVSVQVTKFPELDAVELSVRVDPADVSLNRPLREGDAVIALTGFAYNPEFLNHPDALPMSPADLAAAGIPYETRLIRPLYPGYPAEVHMTFPNLQTGEQVLGLTLKNNATVQTGVFVSVRESYGGLYREGREDR